MELADYNGIAEIHSANCQPAVSDVAGTVFRIHGLIKHCLRNGKHKFTHFHISLCSKMTAHKLPKKLLTTSMCLIPWYTTCSGTESSDKYKEETDPAIQNSKILEITALTFVNIQWWLSMHDRVSQSEVEFTNRTDACWSHADFSVLHQLKLTSSQLQTHKAIFTKYSNNNSWGNIFMCLNDINNVFGSITKTCQQRLYQFTSFWLTGQSTWLLLEFFQSTRGAFQKRSQTLQSGSS